MADEWSLMRKGQKANQREFPSDDVGQNYPPTDNRGELEPASLQSEGKSTFALVCRKSFFDGKIMFWRQIHFYMD